MARIVPDAAPTIIEDFNEIPGLQSSSEESESETSDEEKDQYHRVFDTRSCWPSHVRSETEPDTYDGMSDNDVPELVDSSGENSMTTVMMIWT